MNEELITNKSIFTVTQAMTATAMGSGDLPVLATPSLVAIMENAAMIAARRLCNTDETTVGASIDVKHLLPSPVGKTIEATATITTREGRKLDFTITASQDGQIIGTASHTRYIVNRNKFMQKL